MGTPLDKRRERFAKDLHPLYIEKYLKLCELLPKEWQPYWGFRTFEQQENIYKIGRTVPPIGQKYWKTKAKGWQSPHNYGCATDWTLWEKGKPIWLAKKDPRWKVYVDACEKAGLRHGASFGDWFHNELPISVKWSKINEVREKLGLDRANEMIVEVHVAGL